MDFNKIYNSAYYLIYDINYKIKLNDFNPVIDALFDDIDIKEWGFITGFNPQSISHCKEENNSFNENLFNDLNEYTILLGEGGDIEGDWEPEKSFLVLGINKKELINSAIKYNQKAVIYGEINKVAELLFI